MRKEIIASVLAVVVAAASMAVFAGCGNANNDQTATTSPSTTVAATTQKATVAATQSSNTQSSNNAQGSDTQSSNAQSSDTQSSAQSSESSADATYGTPHMDDNALAALEAAGYSADDGFVAQLTGTTHNVEGTFNIYAITDAQGNYLDNVYVHTSGSPTYYGKAYFDDIHSSSVTSESDADAEVY